MCLKLKINLIQNFKKCFYKLDKNTKKMKNKNIKGENIYG